MALLDALEAVIRENKAGNLEKLSQAIATWARKKKVSLEELRKLRREYVDGNFPADVASDVSLTKVSTILGVSSSLARLVFAESDDPGHGMQESEASADSEPISRSWLVKELNEISRSQQDAMKFLFEKMQTHFTAQLENFKEKVMGQIEESRHEIEALKMITSDQEEKINKLESKLATIERASEEEERQRRSCNIVVEGLVSKKDLDNASLVRDDLFASKLQVDVRPVQVVRLRTPSDRKPKLLIRLGSKEDKITVLRNCRKLKSFPDIRVWEDLTPAQQARRRDQLPKFKQLRSEGKRVFFRGDRLFVKQSETDRPILVP